MNRIKITKEANKFLKEQPQKVRDRIMKNIASPPPSSYHHYTGQYDNMYVLKLHDFRMICRKDGDDIVVESCGVRGDIYKRTRHKHGRNISA